MRNLYFGGNFDPPHNGHLTTARITAELLKFDKVILIPSAQPPQKINTTSFSERLYMCQSAVLNDSLFQVSDIETKIIGPSYTLNTVKAIKEKTGTTEPVNWLIGSDTILRLPSWYKWEELAKEVVFIIAQRPGYVPNRNDGSINPLFETILNKIQWESVLVPQIEISSTMIRGRIAAKLPIDNLVPHKVIEIIENMKLYQRKTKC